MPCAVVRSGLAGLILALVLLVPGLLVPGANAAMAASLTIVVLGDSLTAGYGLAPGESFPDQLGRALKARGADVEIVNAGVSGDTASDGLARLDWALPDDASAVIVELGGNDMLRGLDPEGTRRALDAILTELGRRGLPVILAGMEASRNLGQAYVEAFGTIFPDLAEKHGALLYPFFLDGVALDPALNQPDGLHPNARGVAVIVERMLPTVEKLIARARGR
ncbi:MAG: arylesterase [Hyphomicrobiaceae bacterium]